jgi:hypothetical protein
MSVKTYQGQIKQGQVFLKERLQLPEGTRVYVVVPDTEGTALDPSTSQILSDIRIALSEFSNDDVFEIESADDLLELIENLD